MCFSSTATFEDQDDVEANEAIWTMLELEHLLVFINNSLGMTFPLYIVCKHNHICALEVSLQLQRAIFSVPLFF